MVVVLAIIGLITYSGQKDDQRGPAEGRSSSRQKFEKAGLPVPDQDILTRSLGTDGGAVCDNPASALGKALLHDQLTNGADFVGRRPIIIDRRIVLGRGADPADLLPGQGAGLPGQDRRPEVRRHDQGLMSEHLGADEDVADGPTSTAPEPGRPAAGGVLAAACVSTLVVNANTSAVTILLPSISEDVDAPVAQLQWAVTGYSLVGAAVIVTSGALGDVLGRRKVFLAGLALFVALVRADRAVDERSRRGRRPHDPGRRRARRSWPAA